MIEKIKGWVIWVVTPLAFIAGFIYYLLTKNESLKDALARAKASEEQGKEKNEQDKADATAATSRAEYATLRAKFLERNGLPGDNQGGGQGSSGSGPSNQNP